MLNNQYVSVKSIIAKLYSGLQLKEEENFTDIIEWCAEALDFIHVFPQYTLSSAEVKVTNFKAELPCDYIQMQAIERDGYSITYSTNSFGPQDNSTRRRSDTPYSYNEEKIRNAVFVDPNTTNYFRNRDSVLIQGGYIKTSFETGCMNINYISMVTDDEGYPMIPDNVSFKEALYWYCVYKYLYPKWLANEINGQAYQDAYNKWLWYCNQAGAEALMPDLITLENIKRAFISLKPNLLRSNNFYDGLNKNY